MMTEHTNNHKRVNRDNKPRQRKLKVMCVWDKHCNEIENQRLTGYWTNKNDTMTSDVAEKMLTYNNL
jgi:hypothetical protein